MGDLNYSNCPPVAGRATKQSKSDEFFGVGVRQADREGCSAKLATHKQANH